MKLVLFVSHTLDFAAGGAERVLHDVLLRIDRKRFTPMLFVAGDPGGVPSEFQALDLPIDVHRQFPLDIERRLIDFLRMGFALVSLAVSLWRRLGRDPIDVVHVNSVFALHFAVLPCRLRRVRLVYHEHGLPRNGERSPWAHSYPFLIRRVDHTIAITETVRQQVLSYDVEPSSVTTIHNGIDPHTSHESTSRENRPSGDASGQDFTVVQIANFLDWKGHETVIRALARPRDRVPGARVVFFGQSRDLEYEARLRVLVAEKKLKSAVAFAGYRRDLMDFLDTFDCLVLASRAGPFGLVLLEAMRAGLPVVASNAGGVPEIIKDGVNGLLFEPEDFEGLATALARIAQNPEAVARLRREGKKTIVDRFSFDAQIAGMQKAFEAEAR